MSPINLKRFVILGLGICIWAWSVPNTQAEESKNKTEASVTVVPMRYIDVKGDIDKFQAQHWTKAGFSAGFEDLEIKQQIDKKTVAEFTGHSFSRDNNWGSEFEINREDLGFFKISYDTFRKYYDNSGGYYYRYTTLPVSVTPHELHMDIGKFEAEIGLKMKDLPELTAFFGQETKNGTKSRLSWTPVIEGSTTKLIGPVWQDVYDTVDTFGLRGRHDVRGVNVTGEQKWEIVRGHVMREERNLSTNGTASERKVRQQDLSEQSNAVTTTLGGEKWFWKDTGFMALRYRHFKIDNSEVEFLREFDEALNPRSFSNPKNKFNATADNKLENNIVAGDFRFEAMKNLNFISKIKTEVISRNGGSITPHEQTDPPDTINNFTNIAESENSTYRTSGAIGFRYSGIKRTSLYTDLEVERTRNWLQEYQDSIAGQAAGALSDVFERETLTHSTKWVFTLGGRTVPSKYLNLTTQYRHRIENNDYDDIRESAGSSSSDKSAFTDFQQLGGDEFTTKWNSKLAKTLTSSVRYQYSGNTFVMRTDSAVNQRSYTGSHTMTYGLSWVPTEKLMFDVGYSRQLSKTTTPVSKGASPQIPSYKADINNWSFASTYLINEKISLFQSFNKYAQDNFNDYSTVALPYGTDSTWYENSLGLKWAMNKTVTIEPKYTYYSYKGSDKDIDFGGYSAQSFWLGVDLNWF